MDPVDEAYRCQLPTWLLLRNLKLHEVAYRAAPSATEERRQIFAVMCWTRDQLVARHGLHDQLEAWFDDYTDRRPCSQVLKELIDAQR